MLPPHEQQHNTPPPTNPPRLPPLRLCHHRLHISAACCAPECVEAAAAAADIPGNNTHEGTSMGVGVGCKQGVCAGYMSRAYAPLLSCVLLLCRSLASHLTA